MQKITRKPKTWSQIGHVRFPVHDPAYTDLAQLKPGDGGVLTVRLLVEDTTLDGRHVPVAGPTPQRDDFLVGCDKLETQAAHAYLGEDRKIVENILCGIIDWAGVRNVPRTDDGPPAPDGAMEFFRCAFSNLDEAAQLLYRDLENVRYPGCQLWLVTSLNQNPKTVDGLMIEAQRARLELQDIPKIEQTPILCMGCAHKGETVLKPLMGAKRLGWKKIGHKGTRWLCPMHAAQDRAEQEIQ